jgi:hypothetical protein
MMMKLRFLHYLLKDKEGYHKDDNLKQRWDTYLYILNTLTKQSLPLLKDKFIYFLKYKKLTTLKRFLIGFFIVGTIYYSGSFGIKSIKNYLNTEFGWFQKEKENIVTSIYVPDTIEMKIYQKKFMSQTGLNESQILQKFEFITVYTVDSTKTLKKFLERLGQIESGNNYKSRRAGSEYLGRWQMGDGARRTIGFGSISYDKFLNTPEIQDAAVILYLKYNYEFLKSYLKKYDNKIIRGYHLTKSGLIAMAHNVGPDAVLKFLNSNCSIVPRDGNGPSDRFLILGNYDLSSLEK